MIIAIGKNGGREEVGYVRPAVGVLEELLNESRVRGYLENVLYAKPLPPSADIPGALDCCEATTHSKIVRDVLQALEVNQQAIREVRLA